MEIFVLLSIPFCLPFLDTSKLFFTLIIAVFSLWNACVYRTYLFRRRHTKKVAWFAWTFYTSRVRVESKTSNEICYSLCGRSNQGNLKGQMGKETNDKTQVPALIHACAHALTLWPLRGEWAVRAPGRLVNESKGKRSVTGGPRGCFSPAAWKQRLRRKTRLVFDSGGWARAPVPILPYQS